VTFPTEPFPTIETVPTRPFPANPNHREATETSQTEPGRSRPPRQTEPILWSLRHAFPSQSGPLRQAVPNQSHPSLVSTTCLPQPARAEKHTNPCRPCPARHAVPLRAGPLQDDNPGRPHPSHKQHADPYRSGPSPPFFLNLRSSLQFHRL